MKIAQYRAFVLAGLFAFLAFFSAALAWREYTAYRVSADLGVQDFLEIDGAGDVLALSTAADRYVLTGCLRAASSVRGVLLAPDERARLLGVCRDIAGEITGSSAQDSFGWYVLAYLAVQQTAVTEAERALAASYRSGPTEQWIAELRVPLAESVLAQLGPETVAAHLRDLALLVQSRRGIGAIARRYVQDPGFRERITGIVETLPQADQQRFLSVLKGEVRRFRNGS